METKEKQISSLIENYKFWTNQIHGLTDLANKYASDLASLRGASYLTSEQEKELYSIKRQYMNALKARNDARNKRDDIGYQIIHIQFADSFKQ